MATEKEVRAKISAKNEADRAFREFINLQKQAARVVREIQTPLEKYNSKIRDLNKMLAQGALSQKQHVAAVKSAADAYRKAESGRRGGGTGDQQAFREFIRLQRGAEQAIRDIETPLQRYNKRIRDLNAMLRQGALNHKQHTAAVRRLRAEYGKAPRGGMEQTTQALINVGVAINSVRGVLEIGSAAVAAGRGEWDKYFESLYRLPLGFGEIARSSRGLIDYFTGLSAALRREAAEHKRIVAEVAAERAAALKIDEKIAADTEAARARAAQLATGATRAKALVGMDPRQRALKQREWQADDELAAIQKQRDAVRNQFGKGDWRYENLNRELVAQDRAIVEKLFADQKMMKQRFAAESRRQRESERQGREAKDRMEQQAAERARLALRRIETEAYAEDIKRLKGDLAAKIVLVDAHWKARVEAARDGAEREALMRRWAQERLGAEDGARDKPGGRGGYAGVDMPELASRMTGVGARFASEQATQNLARQQLREQQRIAEYVNRLDDTMKQVAQVLAGGAALATGYIDLGPGEA